MVIHRLRMWLTSTQKASLSWALPSHLRIMEPMSQHRGLWPTSKVWRTTMMNLMEPDPTANKSRVSSTGSTSLSEIETTRDTRIFWCRKTSLNKYTRLLADRTQDSTVIECRIEWLLAMPVPHHLPMKAILVARRSKMLRTSTYCTKGDWGVTSFIEVVSHHRRNNLNPSISYPRTTQSKSVRSN